MKYKVRVLGKEFEVEVDEVEKNVFEVVVNGKRAVIKIEEL
jgi:hypothetical protein